MGDMAKLLYADIRMLVEPRKQDLDGLTYFQQCTFFGFLLVNGTSGCVYILEAASII